MTRTIHLGTPKPEEINAYTRVLMGLIQFSTLTFPADMGASVADVMARAPLWDAGLDYFHGTSHGIGSFSSVHECNYHHRFFFLITYMYRRLARFEFLLFLFGHIVYKFDYVLFNFDLFVATGFSIIF